MNDFLERLGAFVPTYLRETLSLVSGPKRFISAKLSSGTDSIRESLVYLAVSAILIGIMLTPPLTDTQQMLAVLVRVLIELIIMSVISAWSVWLSWRIVGGVSPISPYIVIYCYYSGVAFLIGGLTLVVLMGVIRVFDSVGVEVAMRRLYFTGGPMENSELYLVYGGIVAVGGLALALWGLAGWGAYRELNGASRMRSAVALALTLMFGTLLTIAGYFLGRGMA